MWFQTNLAVAVLSLPFLSLSITAQSHETKKSSHSSSHRVVVVNGKTVIDEKIVDGKKVGGARVPAAKDDLLRRARASGEIDDLLGEIQRRLRREMPKAAPVRDRKVVNGKKVNTGAKKRGSLRR